MGQVSQLQFYKIVSCWLNLIVSSNILSLFEYHASISNKEWFIGNVDHHFYTFCVFFSLVYQKSKKLVCTNFRDLSRFVPFTMEAIKIASRILKQHNGNTYFMVSICMISPWVQKTQRVFYGIRFVCSP